jgi:hypothetical protein
MRDGIALGEKLKTLERLTELGGEDRIIDQTITKLLDYTTQRHQRELEELTTKLRVLEEQFGMTSDLFANKFHRGELGDDEAFFRWGALLNMQQHLTQRLAILQADDSS